MAPLAVLALLGAVSASPPQNVPSCALSSPQVESVIAAKAKELGYAEYCQFRRYETLVDLDGDGKDDFIVLFTVEGPHGANDHIDFMAVFLSGTKGGPLLVQTGRRGVRDPEEIDARKGRIVLKTREYLPKDPMCCPSGKGELTYKLLAGKLALVR